MHRGEVLSLSWADVDFAAKRINLRRQFVRVGKQGLYTQNLYTHNTLKMQEEAAAIFAKSLQVTL